MASASRIETWLEKVLHDATQRELPDLHPLLESMARSMAELRAADWNDDASGVERDAASPDGR